MDSPAVLHVNLLAGFRVAVGERSVPAAAWRQKRAAAIIKLLALEPAHRLHREQVLDALWPDLDPESGAANLRVALHHARTRLVDAGAMPGAFLVRDGDSLALGPGETVRVDVDVFERAAARAWQVAEPDVVEVALGHYAGDLLPDDLFDDWVAPRRMNLRASYLALLARLARLAEHRAETDRAVAAYQRILTLEPAQEEAHLALMHLFALGGQRLLALAQYRRLAAVLDREFGTVPEPATRALYNAIRTDRPTPPEPPRDPVPAPHWTMLPAPVDTLIGRDRERGEIRQLLATVRLVTLTGPGGVGKTRLALAVAGDVIPTFPAGAVFVDLAPVRDPALVIPAIARAIGPPDAGRTSDLRTLARSLGDARLLLVLDNFEQVVEAAPHVTGLLRSCPGLKVLVTSRVRLRLSGEHERPVPPLAMPEPGPHTPIESVARAEGVRLFVERGRAVQPGFAVTVDNAPAIVAICCQVDGLPLAIELAAARVKALPPNSLLARLEKRLPLLTGGGRDLPQRQRTMRDTIAWSHDLLTAGEQGCFRRLAVFVGGCTLALAGPVVAADSPSPYLDAVEAVTALVDNSLLQRVDVPGGEPRYAMLETVREFGLEQLAASGEEAPVRGAHAAAFLAFVERIAPALRGPMSGRELVSLERDHGNLRAALTWFEESGEGEALLRLASALGTFWSENGHWTEGNAWLERALALDPRPSLARVEALANLGENAGYQGHAARAEAALHEGIELARQLGATAQVAFMLQSLGGQRVDQGAYITAQAILVDAMAEARRAGDREIEALSLAHFGAASWGLGNVTGAVDQLTEVLAIGRASAQPVPVEVAARYLGLIAAASGDLHGAAAWYRQSLPGDSESIQVPVRLVLDVASLAMAQGKAQESARLFGAAAALTEAIGFAPSWPERGVHEAARSTAQTVLGPAFETAIDTGRRLPPAAVLAEVTAVLNAAAAPPQSPSMPTPPSATAR